VEPRQQRLLKHRGDILTSPPTSGTGPLTRGLHGPHGVAGIIGDKE